MSDNVTTPDFESWKRQNDLIKDQAGKESDAALHRGGGGAGPMEPTVNMKDYVDARDAELEAKLLSKLGTLATSNEVRNNIWGAVVTIIVMVLAILAFGGDRFDGGIAADAMMDAAKEDQQVVDRRQDQKLNDMDRKLDVLLERSSK